MTKKLSVVIPVYNEIETIEELITRVLSVDVDKELIIVDNVSTDGTRELVQTLASQSDDISVILQERNMMKGNSVRRGIDAAQGEYIVIQDGDLEYNPHDFIPMLEVCEQTDVLAVLGSRILGAKAKDRKITATSFAIGRSCIDAFFRVLYQSSLTDTSTCYKMAPAPIYKSLSLKCNSFDLDFELSAKFSVLARRMKMRVAEVPVDYFPRSVEQGKKIRWQDGVHALRTLWWCRFAEPLKSPGKGVDFGASAE